MKAAASHSTNLDDFEILFEGTIALHSKQKTTKVIMVDHTHHKCIEIVAYNAAISLETARLYLNSPLLVEKINCSPDFAIKMTTTIENREASSEPFDFPAFRKDLLRTYIVKYILARLDMPKDLARGAFGIILKVMEGDVADSHGRLDILRSEPSNFKIYEFETNKRDHTGAHAHAPMKFGEHKSEDPVHLPSLGGAPAKPENSGRMKHGGVSHADSYDNDDNAISVHRSRPYAEANSRRLSAANEATKLVPITPSKASAKGGGMQTMGPPPPKLKKQGSVDDSVIRENTGSIRANRYVPALAVSQDRVTPPSQSLGSASGTTAETAPSVSFEPEAVSNASIKKVIKRQASIKDLIEGKNINNLPALSNSVSTKRRASLTKSGGAENNAVFGGRKAPLLSAEDLPASDSEDDYEGDTNAGLGLPGDTDHSGHIHGLKLMLPTATSTLTTIPLDNISADTSNSGTPTSSSRRVQRRSLGSINFPVGSTKNSRRPSFDVLSEITGNLNIKLSALDPNTPSFARQTLTSLIQISDQKTPEQRRKSSLVPKHAPAIGSASSEEHSVSRRALRPLGSGSGEEPGEEPTVRLR